MVVWFNYFPKLNSVVKYHNTGSKYSKLAPQQQCKDRWSRSQWYLCITDPEEYYGHAFYTYDVAEFLLTEVKLTPTWSHGKLPGVALRFNMHSLHSCRYDSQGF